MGTIKILASTSKNQSAHRSKNTVPDQNLIKNATKFHGKIVMMYHMKFVIWSIEKTAKMCLIRIANKFHGKIVTPSIRKFPVKSLKRPFRVCNNSGKDPYRFTDDEIADYDFIELRTGAVEEVDQSVEEVTTKKPVDVGSKSSSAITFG